MHLGRVRLGRKAFALLTEHLALEPRQLMLQRTDLIAQRRDGSRLRQDEVTQVHAALRT